MKVVDLFCGCGGMSLGFQNAGFQIIAAFDLWDAAIQVYERNFTHPVMKQDLSELNAYKTIEKWKPDIIIGGPPCQDFSSAGKRDESLGRADLTLGFASIVSHIRPRWFVMENVERIRKSKILRLAIDTFRENKYGLTEVILDASLCGVPQIRKRYFLIGELNGENESLTYFFNKNQSNSPMSIFDYLGDSLGIEYYYRHPRSYQRRAIFSIHEPSPTVRGVNRPMPKTYQVHPSDACKFTENIRSLTTLERSYIQTFPRTFNFEGSKTDLEQMIGNAVPIKLAEYVASSILEYISAKTKSAGCLSDRQLRLFEKSAADYNGST